MEEEGGKDGRRKGSDNSTFKDGISNSQHSSSDEPKVFKYLKYLRFILEESGWKEWCTSLLLDISVMAS